MDKKLSLIKARIQKIQDGAVADVEQLRATARQHFAKLMEPRAAIVTELVEKLNSSRELTNLDGDEYFHRFIRIDFHLLIEDKSDEFEFELLTDWLAETHAVGIDEENECLTLCEGPCILINEDGDVLDQDSGRWFIKRQQYDGDLSVRNALIEQYMQETGVFPSVIRCDKYGNAYYVNTKLGDDAAA
jgi:hypothetical protein